MHDLEPSLRKALKMEIVDPRVGFEQTILARTKLLGGLQPHSSRRFRNLSLVMMVVGLGLLVIIRVHPSTQLLNTRTISSPVANEQLHPQVAIPVAVDGMLSAKVGEPIVYRFSADVPRATGMGVSVTWSGPTVTDIQATVTSGKGDITTTEQSFQWTLNGQSSVELSLVARSSGNLVLDIVMTSGGHRGTAHQFKTTITGGP